MCAQTLAAGEEVCEYVKLLREKARADGRLYARCVAAAAVASCERLAAQIAGEADGSIAPPAAPPPPPPVERPASGKGKKAKKAAPPPPKPVVPKWIPAPQPEGGFKLDVKVVPADNIVEFLDNGFGLELAEAQILFAQLSDSDKEMLERLRNGAELTVDEINSFNPSIVATLATA